MNKISNLTNLGKKSIIYDNPNIKILEKVQNPNRGINYNVRFSCPEFTSICPVTGQPDFGILIIDYVPNKWIVESKSFKLYLNSFRNHGSFHEECTLIVAKSLIQLLKPKWLRIGAYWNPRGGIPIDVFWQSCSPPEELFLPEQNIKPYLGRS